MTAEKANGTNCFYKCSYLFSPWDNRCNKQKDHLTAKGFLELLSQKAAHTIQPDLVYSGGFFETKKIAALAEAFYVRVAPHNCRGPLGTVIAMHLCANIPNFQILETFEDYDVSWRCDLTPGTPRVKNGTYELPARPGWGVEVDEELLAAHPENPDAKLNMFSDGWEQLMCR